MSTMGEVIRGLVIRVVSIGARVAHSLGVAFLRVILLGPFILHFRLFVVIILAIMILLDRVVASLREVHILGFF